MQGGKEKYKFLNRVKRNPFYARWQGKIFIFFSVARENVVLSIYLSIYLSICLSIYTWEVTDVLETNGGPKPGFIDIPGGSLYSGASAYFTCKSEGAFNVARSGYS